MMAPKDAALKSTCDQSPDEISPKGDSWQLSPISDIVARRPKSPHVDFDVKERCFLLEIRRPKTKSRESLAETGGTWGVSAFKVPPAPWRKRPRASYERSSRSVRSSRRSSRTTRVSSSRRVSRRAVSATMVRRSVMMISVFSSTSPRGKQKSQRTRWSAGRCLD
jgi:hypothetical protein